MLSQLRRCRGLDSLELKALSVPSSLRFLLGIEYDVVLCVTEVGSHRSFELHFPVFAETFRKLLSLCAMRFSLECTHNEDGSSTLFGTAVMPLLRYADYLPGALHVEELLECLQVVASTSPKRRNGGGSGGSAAFNATFLDYSEFASDDSLSDVHGLGFYLTLDYGLSLASHGHLVEIRLHDDWDPKEAIREFQEFSGWDTFDLRIYDDHNKREGGVIVFPTIQDVCDLLEKYEDEDSDDEGDILPFILRPVAPLVPVPSVEDSVLRKQREQSWPEIVKFWERFPRSRNTVVVYNLFDGATLPEVLSFVSGLPVVKSSLVEDCSPQRRRRAFITFADADSARKAMELDGKSTKGRTLRVQVAPPYISEERRGSEVKEVPPKPKNSVRRSAGAAASGDAAPLQSPPPGRESGTDPNSKQAAREAKIGRKGESQKTKASYAGSPLPAPASTQQQQSPQIPQVAPVAAPTGAKALEAAWAFATHGHGHGKPGVTTTTTMTTAAAVVPGTSPSLLSVAAPTVAAGREGGGKSPSLTHMNAEAKEFVPTFRLSVNSPEFHPDAAPPAYVDPLSLLPPPPPPPPPSYGSTLSPASVFVSGPPAPRSLTASAKLSHSAVGEEGMLPPSYTLPPPYQCAGTPSAVGAVGGQPLPPPPPFLPTSPALHFGAGPPPPPPPPPYQGN